MPQDPAEWAIALTLIASCAYVARIAEDTFGLLKRVGIAVVVVSAFAFVVVAQPFSRLIAQLTVSAALGVVVGSWPDPIRRWPRSAALDVRAFPTAAPHVLAGVVGVLLGGWVWSQIADVLGVVGVLLGGIVFVPVTLGVGAAPELIADWLTARRSGRSSSSDEPGTS